MTIDVITPPALARMRDITNPAMRRRLFSLAGNAVSILIDRYLRKIAPTRHKTANRLGATPTRHLERNTSFTATSSHADVTIPIPGISRAFHSLLIMPKKAAALTLPISSLSYGKTVNEMRANGWRMFRPAAKGSHRTAEGRFSAYQDLLLGSRPGENAVPLWLLKKRVSQKQDRTLLPSDAEIDGAIATATAKYLDLVAKGAA